MNAPLRRRRDPQPLDRGWELAVVVIGGALVVAALAALAGVGLAAASWGGGWLWPPGTEGITAVVGGLVRGDPAAGYPAEQRSLLAGALATYLCVAAAELAVWSGVAFVVVAVRGRLLPGDERSGMATRADADAALGVRQLRAARSLIRPDLLDTHRRLSWACKWWAVR